MEKNKRVAPPLPFDPRKGKQVIYELNNTGLDGEQFKSLYDLKIDSYIIEYSGDFDHLDFLLDQLGQVRNRKIQVNIGRLDKVDRTVMLPLYLMDQSVILSFVDNTRQSSGFYSYLQNVDESIFKAAMKHTNCYIQELPKERRILGEFLDEFNKTLLKRGKNLSDYSKKQLMDFVFRYVCKNFPYDFSIVDPKTGGVIACTHNLGGTAAVVWERGKGICAGRSRLIKLLANNYELQVPCYLVEGNHGQLGHCWNEFIDEDGTVYEYDSSFNKICKYNELPSIYKIENHEPEVERKIRQIR